MRTRSAVVPLLVGALIAATVGWGAPASAGSHAGVLAVRGPGSLFSLDEVSLAAAPGASATFSVQVLNKGADLAQFNVRIRPPQDPNGTPYPPMVSVTKGALVVTGLATGTDGYYTAPIAPGKAEVLTVKVTVPKGTAVRTFGTGVQLLSTDGTTLGWGSLTTEVPATGHSVSDIYARQGSQAYVGGSVNQVASSPAVKKGSSVTFSIKVQNDGTVPKAIGIFFHRDPVCGTFTVKDGSTDITSHFWEDGSSFHGYPTPTLKPGASKVLTLVYKRTSDANCYGAEYADFSTLYGFFEGGESVRVLVPMAIS